MLTICYLYEAVISVIHNAVYHDVNTAANLIDKICVPYQ